MNTPARANTCPSCGRINQCAMEIEQETGVKQAPCWCTEVKFDAELLDRIPADKHNLACICANCAQSAKQIKTN